MTCKQSRANLTRTEITSSQFDRFLTECGRASITTGHIEPSNAPAGGVFVSPHASTLGILVVFNLDRIRPFSLFRVERDSASQWKATNTTTVQIACTTLGLDVEFVL